MPSKRQFPRSGTTTTLVFPALRSIRLLAAAGATALLVFGCAIALAHDAPSGWNYPFACCSGYDCRPVKTSAVSERPEGYVINPTGEVLAYSDRRIRSSPDGEFHWCSKNGAADGATICLFVPPRLF